LHIGAVAGTDLSIESKSYSGIYFTIDRGLNTLELSAEILRRSGELTGTVKSNNKDFTFTIETATKQKSAKSDSRQKSSAKQNASSAKSADNISIKEEGGRGVYWFKKDARFLMVSREGKSKKLVYLITSNPALGPGKW
jgi:ribosomal protein S17